MAALEEIGAEARRAVRLAHSYTEGAKHGATATENQAAESGSKTEGK